MPEKRVPGEVVVRIGDEDAKTSEDAVRVFTPYVIELRAPGVDLGRNASRHGRTSLGSIEADARTPRRSRSLDDCAVRPLTPQVAASSFAPSPARPGWCRVTLPTEAVTSGHREVDYDFWSTISTCIFAILIALTLTHPDAVGLARS